MSARRGQRVPELPRSYRLSASSKAQLYVYMAEGVQGSRLFNQATVSFPQFGPAHKIARVLDVLCAVFRRQTL